VAMAPATGRAPRPSPHPITRAFGLRGPTDNDEEDEDDD